jgi:hypothetical protein
MGEPHLPDSLERCRGDLVELSDTILLDRAVWDSRFVGVREEAGEQLVDTHPSAARNLAPRLHADRL